MEYPDVTTVIASGTGFIDNRIAGNSPTLQMRRSGRAGRKNVFRTFFITTAGLVPVQVVIRQWQRRSLGPSQDWSYEQC